MGKQ
ncbi:hypothetical protein LINPERHAP1_LOCUS8243 [Linum perenne]|jgi:Leucine-rich repeat (LRR) protein